MKYVSTLTKLLSVVAAVFLLVAPSYALDLGQAKNQGLVGETPSGYLASVQPNPRPDVAQLIQSINSQRKAEYQRIAKRTGASVQSVEQLAGQKAINKSPRGHFVSDGRSWRKK